MTEAQSNALDAYWKANAEALCTAKMALLFALGDKRLSGPMRVMLQKALDFYSAPQISKILDA
jgi:hypothetical protein